MEEKETQFRWVNAKYEVEVVLLEGIHVIISLGNSSLQSSTHDQL